MNARLAAALLLLALSACGQPRSEATSHVTVFATSSLTESFRELGSALETARPGLGVTFHFAATSSLVRQIREGARADVFAAADDSYMKPLVSAGLVDAPTVFAHNRMAIVTPAGNSKQIQSLADLTAPGVVVVLCGEQVPCGALAGRALAKANVTVNAVSREDNVKSVLTKVRLGEADAGIVYVTDARAAGDTVERIDIPDAHNVTGRYSIAILNDAPNPAGARAFVAHVTSSQGLRTMQQHGFQPPA